jgi:excisionase family DNA binding protein
MAFGRAYRLARERRNSRNSLPPHQERYLTLTEAAAILGTDRVQALRLLHDRELPPVRTVPDKQALTVAQIAAVLDRPPAAVYAMLHSGELTATRSGDRGHYRITADKMRRHLLSSAPPAEHGLPAPMRNCPLAAACTASSHATYRSSDQHGAADQAAQPSSADQQALPFAGTALLPVIQNEHAAS